MTLDRHVGTITCGECGRTWHGRGEGIAFCGWCGAYFGPADAQATRPRGDRRRRSPRGLQTGLVGAVAVAGLASTLTWRSPGPAEDSGVELAPAPAGVAAGTSDPSVGQTGPWCRTPTRTQVPCTRWLVTTIDDPTAWLGTTGDVVVRLTEDGALEARALVDGSVRWTLRPGWGAVEAAAQSGRVLVRSGAVLRGVDAATGSVMWETALPASIRGMRLTDAVAIVSLDDHRLLGIDPVTGGALWTVTEAPGDAVVATPEVAAVADASAATVTTYELRTGEQRWSTRVGGAAAAVALVGDEDRIVVMTTFAVALRALGEVTSLDAGDGTMQWRHPLPADRGGRIPMALDDGLVLLGTIGSDTQPLVALGVDGAVDWARAFGPGGVQPAVSSDPGLLAITDLGLMAVDPADGAYRWFLELRTSAVSGTGLIVAAGENVLVGLEPPA